jgi:hypothetical protein
LLQERDPRGGSVHDLAAGVARHGTQRGHSARKLVEGAATHAQAVRPQRQLAGGNRCQGNRCQFTFVPCTMLCRPLHDKFAPRQPSPPAEACVASPYRVGRQHGECPSRTPRPGQAVGQACLRGPAWFQRPTVSTNGREGLALGELARFNRSAIRASRFSHRSHRHSAA